MNSLSSNAPQLHPPRGISAGQTLLWFAAGEHVGVGGDVARSDDRGQPGEQCHCAPVTDKNAPSSIIPSGVEGR